MFNKVQLKKIDYIFLILLPITAAAISLSLQTEYLITTLLFFWVTSTLVFSALAPAYSQNSYFYPPSCFPLGSNHPRLCFGG